MNRKCNKCGWTGPESQTRNAGEFRYGCPVCRDRVGYMPTDRIIPQQPVPALEINDEWGVMGK